MCWLAANSLFFQISFAKEPVLSGPAGSYVAIITSKVTNVVVIIFLSLLPDSKQSPTNDHPGLENSRHSHPKKYLGLVW